MNSIKGKLSSKNQITLPKTVRDFIGVTENDSLEFYLEDGRVFLQKAQDIQPCPFCWGGDFYDHPCQFCDGEGTVEALNVDTLHEQLFPIFKGAVIQLDTSGEFTRLTVKTKDDLLQLYREHFQMEYIKLVLRHYRMKDLFNKQLQQELIGLLERQQSREIFTNWWESLKQKNK